MEAFVCVSLACVVGLLIAIAMLLKEIRTSIDLCRAMVSDAVGIPQSDLIDLRSQAPGSVDIPRSYRELVADDDEREELERE